MLELGKVNKTANTSYEQSPAYLASQNQIKRLEEQNKALEQKNKRLQEENRKLRSQSEQTIREINSAAEDYRDPVQTAVKFRMLKINLDLAHKEQERLREETENSGRKLLQSTMHVEPEGKRTMMRGRRDTLHFVTL